MTLYSRFFEAIDFSHILLWCFYVLVLSLTASCHCLLSLYGKEQYEHSCNECDLKMHFFLNVISYFVLSIHHCPSQPPNVKVRWSSCVKAGSVLIAAKCATVSRTARTGLMSLWRSVVSRGSFAQIHTSLKNLYWCSYILLVILLSFRFWDFYFTWAFCCSIGL